MRHMLVSKKVLIFTQFQNLFTRPVRHRESQRGGKTPRHLRSVETDGLPV